MEQKKIAVLVGSLRKESFNRKMAKALVKLAPESLKLEFVEIGELPPYNEDLEAAVPAAWAEFRGKMPKFDGVLFVTPSTIARFPECQERFGCGFPSVRKKRVGGKAGAIMTVSPGAIGGFGANHHLRQMLVFLNVPTMQQPEAYIGGAATLFDERGDLANDSIKEFATKFMTAFAAWVETIALGRNR